MGEIMRKIVVLLTALLGFTSVQADTSVSGYYRKNGTYVQPHYRTNPNSTINDNYSTAPNVNPYTGERGTRSPDYSYPSGYTAPARTGYSLLGTSDPDPVTE